MSSGFRSCFLSVTLLATTMFGFWIPCSAAQTAVDRETILRHGINITRWYNDTTEHPMQKYAEYLRKDSIKSLKDLGFTYFRIPFSLSTLQLQDGSVNGPLAESLIRNVASIESYGLAVMLVPLRQNINFQDDPDNRRRLVRFWDGFSPLLASLDQSLTFPEVLNEPNFRAPGDWDRLQASLVTTIRSHLPKATIIVAGNKWSSIDGLTTMKLIADPNVIYSFHFYYPEFLTSMTGELPISDRAILSHLPFPVSDKNQCQEVGDLAQDIDVKRQVNYYCTVHGTVNDVASRILLASNWGRLNHVVVVDTEFGILDNRQLSARMAYILAVRSACEAHGIGWSLWGYDDGFGFGIKPTDERRLPLNPEIVKALGLAKAE